jgi:hypothetical protein
MPEGAPYRLAVESIIKERQNLIDAFEKSKFIGINPENECPLFTNETLFISFILLILEDQEKIETFPHHLKASSLEDLKMDAEAECQLAKKMALDWKPYLPLSYKSPPGVWPLNLATPTGPSFKN